MRRLTIILLAGIAAFALGGWLVFQLMTSRAENIQRAEATVLLEKVRQVCKLVTVEGDFSEIYNEDNIREVILYLPLPTTWRFTKSALLQVQGKVLVGYDLADVTITIDSTQKQIRLSNLPEPEVLAIDHQLIYRDLEESFFNSFAPEDYTQLNRNAKEALHKKAYESGLIDQARRQGNQMIDAIRYMAEAIGWTVVVDGQAPIPLPAAEEARTD